MGSNLCWTIPLPRAHRLLSCYHSCVYPLCIICRPILFFFPDGSYRLIMPIVFFFLQLDTNDIIVNHGYDKTPEQQQQQQQRPTKPKLAFRYRRLSIGWGIFGQFLAQSSHLFARSDVGQSHFHFSKLWFGCTTVPLVWQDASRLGFTWFATRFASSAGS